MTEAEWLACTDQRRMLDFLRGRASDRRLRRFVAACCRRWDEIDEARQATPGRQAPWTAVFLRDVVGNPFRPPPTVEPAWLSWNGGAVAKLARAIYAERRFADLPLLADALQDAGCADRAILEHCRQPAEHVPGCWVIDLLLGVS